MNFIKLFVLTAVSIIATLGVDLAFGSIYDSFIAWHPVLHVLWKIIPWLGIAIVAGGAYALGMWQLNAMWKISIVFLCILVPLVSSVLNLYVSCKFLHACI